VKENQKPEDLLGCPEDSDLHGEIGNAGEVVRPDNEAINQLLCQTKDTGRNVSLPNETESGKLQDGLSEGKAFVTRSVPKIIYKMCAKYNLPFDSTKLPRIEFSKDKNLDGTYEPDTNTLTISEYVLSSDSELFEAIGEEVGHYLRYQLCKGAPAGGNNSFTQTCKACERCKCR